MLPARLVAVKGRLQTRGYTKDIANANIGNVWR
jgi:hypothetical protein